MPFRIEYARSVADELVALRAYDRNRILDEIEEQLTHQANVPTRRRKVLVGLDAPWEHIDPVWELRVGDWRIYYDIDAETSHVVIRAIRQKPPHRTTEETL